MRHGQNLYQNFVLRLFGICLVFLLFLAPQGHSNENNFKKELGKHFVIYYEDTIDDAWAKESLRKAEDYYDRIASTIGYARYQNFWTWDERVKIIVYGSQRRFMKETQQPKWSSGFVVRDYKLFSSRVIISFFQEEDFLTNALPHEISHLILRDFIGFDRIIPAWLDEGIAQFFEENRRAQVHKVIKLIVQNDKQLPIDELFSTDIRKEKEEWKIVQFYAQSVSIIDFLITKYGSTTFGEMCRYMKDGRDFEEAFKAAYNPLITSTQSLEEKWLNFIRNSSKND